MIQQFYYHGGSWGSLSKFHLNTNSHYRMGQTVRINYNGCRLSLRF